MGQLCSKGRPNEGGPLLKGLSASPQGERTVSLEHFPSLTSPPTPSLTWTKLKRQIQNIYEDRYDSKYKDKCKYKTKDN